ncbi:MAG TPA: hypothetical protein V6C57_19885 [Coleofasciculaceae cyanobacterium]
MSRTGGRIGGYCNPEWAYLAKNREFFESCNAAIAQTVKTGSISVREVEWEMVNPRNVTIKRNTGYLKRSPQSEEVEISWGPPNSSKISFDTADMIDLIF